VWLANIQVFLKFAPKCWVCQESDHNYYFHFSTHECSSSVFLEDLLCSHFGGDRRFLWMHVWYGFKGNCLFLRTGSLIVVVCVYFARVHSVLLGLSDDPEVKLVVCVHAALFTVQPRNKMPVNP